MALSLPQSLAGFTGDSTLHLSWGAGMIRVWHETTGLVLELPAVIALHAETRQPVAWFEEAAALEGKAPEGMVCVRPWWADQMQDRDAFRSLAAQFRQRLWQAFKETAHPPRELKTHWRVAPTTSELHRQWFERTLSEAGWWWPSVRRANYQSLTQEANQTLLMDWGASALRWSLWVKGTYVFGQSEPSLGLSAVAEELVLTEQSVTQRLFSRAALMDLNWSVRHPAFDQKHQEPIFEPLSKTTLQQVQERWLAAYQEKWQDFEAKLPAESAAQLAISPWMVIGGGASLKSWIDPIGQMTHGEWKAPKDPLYVEVRGGAF